MRRNLIIGIVVLVILILAGVLFYLYKNGKLGISADVLGSQSIDFTTKDKLQQGELENAAIGTDGILQLAPIN